MFDLRTDFKASVKQLMDARTEIIAYFNKRLSSTSNIAKCHFPTTIYGLEISIFSRPPKDQFIPIVLSISENKISFLVPENDKDIKFDVTTLVDLLIIKITKKILFNYNHDKIQNLSLIIENLLYEQNWEQLREIYPHLDITVRGTDTFDYRITTPEGAIVRKTTIHDGRRHLTIPGMENQSKLNQHVNISDYYKNGEFYFTSTGLAHSFSHHVKLIFDYLIDDLTLLHLAGYFYQDVKTSAVVLYKR